MKKFMGYSISFVMLVAAVPAYAGGVVCADFGS